MPYDEGVAEILRTDLASHSAVSEKKMFGGLGIMLHGNMICAVHGSGGAMFRVGKAQEAAALALPGTKRMEMGGRTMSGWIDAGDDLVSDDVRRGEILALALAFVQSLPAK